MELPEFAAFALLDNEEGREMLRNYFRAYAAMARDQGTGLLLESMTWRASRDWGAKLGYGPEALADLNRRGIALLAEVRDAFDDDIPHIVISGCLGPRGDGYRAEDAMSAAEAEAYHRPQIAAFRETEADLVSALTMTNVEEAVGVVQAAQAEEMPIVVSFTVETDGNLPSGVSLQAAIETVDAATDAAPAYYMINCAHPTHFVDVLDGGSWTERIRGVRANASAKSHAELDEATELDDGNPSELACDYLGLADRLKNLSVLGGCCGTDERHVEAIARAFALQQAAV